MKGSVPQIRMLPIEPGAGISRVTDVDGSVLV
jgi:hypothetical protein